jgi:hypothetical protein
VAPLDENSRYEVTPVSSLGDMYNDAIMNRYGLAKGWVPNWPLGHLHELGEVGEVVNPGFNRDELLSDHGITAVPAPRKGSSAGPMTVTSSNTIGVAIGTDAKLPAWHWLGTAKAGVEIDFGSGEGIVIGLGTSHYEILENIGVVRKALLDAGRSRTIEVGRSVVVEQLVADSGVVFGSRGTARKMRATTGVEVGLKGLPSLAAFAGGFDITSNATDFVSEPHPDRVCVAVRVITLGKRGWLWWRHLTVSFAVQPTPEQYMAVLESGLMKSDYFASYPDASFEQSKRVPITGDDGF